MELSTQISSIRTGHIFLVICCLIYLVWWSITFNPMKTFPSIAKYILFFGIAAAGAIGGFFVMRTFASMPINQKTISNLIICAFGVIAYIMLLCYTKEILHRVITTELFLIVGWAVLELCVLASVYGAGAISIKLALIMTAVVFISVIISMYCYSIYYNMPPIPAFFIGMVPLILFAAVMLVQAIVIKP